MNQEIKDTLAGLVREADRLEHFEHHSLHMVTPTSNDFLTAQRYRALARHVEELHEVLGEMVRSFGLNRRDNQSLPEYPEIKAARKLLNP